MPQDDGNPTKTQCKIETMHEVKDFDWKMKVVLASSSAGLLYEPLASLNFKTADRDDVTLELNKQQLDEMIAAMDAAIQAAAELER